MNCNILVLSAALEVAASKTCAMSSTESDSSSEDSADEYLEKEREMRIKIVKYVEEIVPKYSLSEFRHHFRLSRGTTEILIGKYNTIREKIYVGGWPEDDDDGENFIENLENFHVDIDPEDIPDVAAVDRRQEILLTL
ncbi:hypothetical protein MML48_1g08947 [Holotrichia oblita]|uniref:Tbc1 domain family member gtpase-activating protein n=7 Tax=Holotrichia oblita TaxID=644536 RepID=A0ACB9T4P6_HOLOL|nr:structural contituent of cuticle [Holotrichia oblita]KAI4460821.1 gtp-binding protein-related [Holotrichia oblita]KAI4461785.1 tbc1 domain family member gtpase-activating protein [Holotrichia oblita]KAI4461786.1 tbc1 domain family member gtpase-activating protein [Holotrichia oblita]KAI4465745.1 leucine-rich repeat and calponin y domain-containing protein 1-like protein [Holotrichia oblita]